MAADLRGLSVRRRLRGALADLLPGDVLVICRVVRLRHHFLPAAVRRQKNSRQCAAVSWERT